MEDESVPDESSEENYEETEKTLIGEELSKMTFQELQKLKERLGCKLYNEAMFGREDTKEKKNFKRENKNRPREMSSKHPFPTTSFNIPSKHKVPRDPRFDSLCGSFNERAFHTAYSFLDDLRSKEKVQLKRELQNEDSETRKERIKYLIQRMENQDREKERIKRKLAKRNKEYRGKIEMLKKGKKPIHVKKSEKKIIDLVEQYESLKKTRKLEKHIEKRRKRNAHKDRKKLEVSYM